MADNNTLVSVRIGDEVTKIGNYLFQNSLALTDVNIGKSVSIIGTSAFEGCNNLTNFTIAAAIPPAITEENFSYQQYFTINLRVPKGSLAMYQFADVWKKFFNISEYDATGIGCPILNDTDKVIPVYNLNGVIMNESEELPTGVYIRNGKKFLVK